MTEVLQSPSHFPSPSSSSSTCAPNNHNSHPHTISLINCLSVEPRVQESEEDQQGGGREGEGDRKERDREGDQLSLLALLVAAFRKSLTGCSSNSIGGGEISAMEIGWPSNVRHVAHVTFDRFDGFLGLPVEFEPEVPRRAPSASANVFGVSTESMQLSFDSRGNSVPTILLMMQRRLYEQGGLEAEGIFRINAENSQEEFVRDQLNRGVVPEGVDVHCLAGLIKAWFRELPTGVLDSLSPEQVMQSQSEEECAQLVTLLPPTEAALLDWAINLMADVVQLQHLNKMNARNIAMVFAPNMTQMADPLTALMYAVQVMNFLKTLIIKTLKEREETVVEPAPTTRIEPSDENGRHSSSKPVVDEATDDNEEEVVVCGDQNFLASIENIVPVGNRSLVDSCPPEVVSNTLTDGVQQGGILGSSRGIEANCCVFKPGQSSSSNPKKGSTKGNGGTIVRSAEKSKGTRIVRHTNSRTERFEAWR